MVTVVFTIGTANILLGYALAVWLRFALDNAASPPAPSSPIAPEKTPQAMPKETPPPIASEDEEEDEEDLLAQSEAVEEIPSQWVDRLEAESIRAKSFVEATAQIMRLEVGKYRDALVRLEDEAWEDGASASQLRRVADRLQNLNRQWLALQAEATRHLQSRVDTLEAFSDVVRQLAKVLEDQQEQIAATCGDLSQFDPGDDAATGRHTLIGEFAQLVDLAHQLRDVMVDALLATMREEGRVDEFDKDMHQDNVTGFLSKTGFEVAIGQWWKTDPGRNRLASALLLDVAGMRRVNRQFSTRFGDQVIGAAGELLDEVLRKERGFEIIARIHGQQFLLFFGDTGPRNATSAAERMRQSFADATFESRSDVMELPVTCAVTELQSSDDVPSLIKRLSATLAAAKENGRNCTMLDEGAGPQPVTPPDYQIPSRVITIQDE